VLVSLPDLPAGVWRHWKGRDYLVLGLGHDADHEGRTCGGLRAAYDVPDRACGPHARDFVGEGCARRRALHYRGPA
jgi:hypothetical protein